MPLLGALLGVVGLLAATGPAAPAPSAAATSGPPATVSVAASWGSVLALGDDGRAYLTDSRRHRVLTLVPGLPDGVQVVQVAASGPAYLVRGDDGLVYGMGFNYSGQLTGTVDYHSRLEPLAGLPAGVRAVDVAGGSLDSLVLGDDGQVYGAGANDEGQLTRGHGVVRVLSPLAGLPGGVDAVDVSGGYEHTLVLGDDGLVYGTGANYSHQLTGPGNSKWILTPLAGLPDGVTPTAVDAGSGHSLVLGDDGVVYGAGSNYSGELTGPAEVKRSLRPLAGLPTGVRAVAIAAGGGTSLVTGDDGVLYGTGSNRRGELTGTDKEKRTLTAFTGLPAGVRVWAADSLDSMSVVLADDGRSYRTTEEGTLVPLGYGVTSIAAPEISGVAVKGGSVIAVPGVWSPVPASYGYQWLRDGRPVSGETSPTHRATTDDVFHTLQIEVTASARGFVSMSATSPITVVTPRARPIAARSVLAGFEYSLVVGRDGQVYGAGNNSFGQLTGPGDSRRALVRLTGLPAGVEAVTAAAGDSRCGADTLVLGDDGVVYGAGANESGQLPGGDPMERTLTPLPGLPRGVHAVSVAAGGWTGDSFDTYNGYSLVLGDDGLVYGVGDNSYGQLTGRTSPKSRLTPLSGLPEGVRARAVATREAVVLVLGDDGVVYGSGVNYAGQLTGESRRRLLAPLVGLPGGVRATAVAMGADHSLVLGNDGVVYGAGGNRFGQLTGDPRQRRTLTSLSGLPRGVRATGVAAGDDFSLVVGSDGLVYGAGFLNGERVLTPVPLPAGVGAAAVAAGDHALVLGDDGRVYGAGPNGSRQLTGIDRRWRTQLTPLVWGMQNGVRPQLTGTTSTGRSLTASHGDWWPAADRYTYAWLRDGEVIPGATARTYRLGPADRGAQLQVEVNVYRPGYQPGVARSRPTAPVS